MYSTETKRSELVQRYKEIVESGEYAFPEEFNSDSTLQFIKEQLEEHGQPAPPDKADELAYDPQESELEYYQNYVEQAAIFYKEQGLLVQDVIAGPINSGEFDATLRTMFGEGAVILVNSGLQSMMWQCGKIIVNGSVQQSDKSQPYYNKDTCSDYLLQVVMHAAAGDPRTARRSHFNSMGLMSMAASIADSHAEFIIGHEIAHLTETTQETHAGITAMELRADKLSMLSIVARVKKALKTNRSANQAIEYSFEVISPLLAMELWHLKRCFSSIRNGKKNISYNLYPSDLTRRDNLVRVLIEEELWLDLHSFYVKNSRLINTTYHLMLDYFEKHSDFRRLDFTITEGADNTTKDRMLYPNLTFSNEKLSSIALCDARVKSNPKSRRGNKGLKVTLNPEKASQYINEEIRNEIDNMFAGEAKAVE